MCGCGRIQFQSTDKSKLVICSTAQCYMISTRRRRSILQHPPPPEMAAFFFYNYLIARRPTAVYSDCNLEYFVFTRFLRLKINRKTQLLLSQIFPPFIAWVYQISVMVVDNVQYKARPSFYSLREQMNELINVCYSHLLSVAVEQELNLCLLSSGIVVRQKNNNSIRKSDK